MSQTATHPFLPLPKAVEQRPRPRVYNASRLTAALSGVHLYVGRRAYSGQRREVAGHPLANPFKLPFRARTVNHGSSAGAISASADAERDACLVKYERWLLGIPNLPVLIGHLRRTWLDGVRTYGGGYGLVCWCAPQKCHADLLADLVALTDAEVAARIRPAAHAGEDLFRSVWLGELGLAQLLADWLIDQGDPRGDCLVREWEKWHRHAVRTAARDREAAAKLAEPFRRYLASANVTGTVEATVTTSDGRGEEFKRFVGRLLETDPNTWGGVINNRLRPFAFPVAIWPGEKDETGDPHHGRPVKTTDGSLETGGWGGVDLAAR